MSCKLYNIRENLRTYEKFREGAGEKASRLVFELQEDQLNRHMGSEIIAVK